LAQARKKIPKPELGNFVESDSPSLTRRVEIRLVAATGAAAGSTTLAARAATIAAATVVAFVEDAREEAFETAVAAAIQMAAALAGIGAAGVVAVAIAGIGTGRMALPIAVIQFAAAAALINFAAELWSTKHLFTDMTLDPTFVTAAAAAVAATAAAIVAAAATAPAAGVATTAAKETINNSRFAGAAMTTAIGNHEKSAEDGQTNKLVREHGELPPGNLERRNRWKRLSRRKANRSQPKANWSNKRATRANAVAAP
jgi:hypothetical protein